MCVMLCARVCIFVRMSGCAALHVSASLYTLSQHNATETHNAASEGGGEETVQNLDFLFRGCRDLSVANLHSHRRASLQMCHTGLKNNTHPQAKLNI